MALLCETDHSLLHLYCQATARKMRTKKVISNVLALGGGCVHNTMNWNVSALKIMHALLSSANNMASSELRVLTLDPRISLNKFGHLKCNKAAEQ